MRISITAKGILLGALAFLFSMIPILPGAPAENQAIFYVTGNDTHYELHVYHPWEGTRTILDLPGETVHELPANAKNAVVVPWPKGK
jgi:hypothetical protein